MWRDGRTTTVRGYYIIDTYCIDFYNVFIREPRVSTYHRMILSKIKGVGVRRNRKYCKKVHLAHFVTKRDHNTRGRIDLCQPKEGGQETNVGGTVERDVDFRGNLEVGGSEGRPEAETHGRPTINPGDGEDFSGSTLGGQETEG